MIGYRIKIPSTTNKFVAQLQKQLALQSSPVILNIKAGPMDEACACFENVLRRVKNEGGESVLGWQFWEHPYMIEAEFHAVWRKPDGSLLDITPKDDRDIQQILFIEDATRTYDGTQTDNVRINSTDAD